MFRKINQFCVSNRAYVCNEDVKLGKCLRKWYIFQSISLSILQCTRPKRIFIGAPKCTRLPNRTIVVLRRKWTYTCVPKSLPSCPKLCLTLARRPRPIGPRGTDTHAMSFTYTLVTHSSIPRIPIIALHSRALASSPRIAHKTTATAPRFHSPTSPRRLWTTGITLPSASVVARAVILEPSLLWSGRL
jgi:hypothetical protein